MEIHISPLKLISYKKREYDRKYNEWDSCLPNNHIECFVRNGIKPFLNRHGYSLGFSDNLLIKYCKIWAFTYIVKNNKKFVSWAHDGGDEEYDWYRHNISMDEWEKLCDYWKAHKFLDDSDIGYKQAIDLHWFIWQCISLENSKQHQIWLNYNTVYDDDEYWVNDDNQAYSGDRRTY
jgi:hypothetical protein